MLDVKNNQVIEDENSGSGPSLSGVKNKKAPPKGPHSSSGDLSAIATAKTVAWVAVMFALKTAHTTGQAVENIR
ncbi:MAG: hypothetical protein LBI70_01270 [Rickettsiales bacterium]|jgi:hypothetical protein|nr:hypothetical protein [Rickettsiales bacterium]